MLVVPELAHEMECLERSEEAGFPQRLRRLRQRRDQLADALQLAAWRQGKLKFRSGDDGGEEEVIEELVESAPGPSGGPGGRARKAEAGRRIYIFFYKIQSIG